MKERVGLIDHHHLSGGFKDFLEFSALPEMIQFDLRICFFQMGGSTTNCLLQGPTEKNPLTHMLHVCYIFLPLA